MILETTGFPPQYPAGETVSAMTLSFWVNFCDELSSADFEVRMSGTIAYGYDAADIQIAGQIMQSFGSVVEPLLRMLLRKLRFPTADFECAVRAFQLSIKR